MKVLIVSPVPTDPGGAGNRERIRTLAAEVTRGGCTVHFAYIPMEPADHAAMQARFGSQRLHLLPWRRQSGLTPLARAARRRFGRLLGHDLGYLYELDEWYDASASEALRALHAKERFDAVIVEYVFASRALTIFGDDVVRVLDTHDCFAMRHRRYLEASERPHWFSTTMALEDQAFRRADYVIGIQDSETDQYRRRLAGSNTTAVTISHVAEHTEPICDPNNQAAVFLGSRNPINVAAVRYFVADILPHIQRELPDFQFVVAGDVCNSIDARRGLIRLGRVERLRDAFSLASVAVNPVRIGTGINIKLLDAMSHGMACVTTACGARGLERHAPSALCISPDDDAKQFAANVLSLLRNREARRLTSQSAVHCMQQWNEEQRSALAQVLNRSLTVGAGHSRVREST